MSLSQLRVVLLHNAGCTKRLWHSSSVCLTATDRGNRIQDWRRRKGLPENPNAYGELTDLPDYSFLDGRPVPSSSGQIRRAMKQRKITEKILSLTGEVDYAVAREARLRKEAQEEKERILQQKLKPKAIPFHISP